jgi:hypothetical protein
MDGATDYAGNPRLRNGFVDIGCYQYCPLLDGLRMVFR